MDLITINHKKIKDFILKGHQNIYYFFLKPHNYLHCRLSYLIILIFINFFGFSQTTIWSENFDGSWTTNFPAGFSSGTTTASDAWHRNDFTTNWTFPSSGSPIASGAQSTTYYARFHSYAITSGNTAQMTKNIDLSSYSGNSITVNFYYINPSGTDELRVRMSSDNGTTYSTINTFYTTSSWTYASVTISSAYIVSGFRLRFVGASDYGGDDIGLDQISIVACTPTGDQTSYGNGSWIGYVYNSSSASSFTTYRGTVTESENFDRDMSTGTPSGATTNICSANSDLFATRYKMNKNYTAGVYTFTVGADDGVRLSVDGGATWIINDWSDHGYRTLTGSAYLSGSTNVVLEYYENSGGARVSISSTMASPTTMQVPSGFINSVKYTTCSGTFYDSGGSSGDYSSSENYTVTFYPSTASGKVRLTFSSFAVETCCDWLKIFNGNSTGATLLGTYTSSPGTITSTAADGSLTIQFYSDGSVTNTGWAATVSCYSPDYITQWISMNVGSTDWCAGESRQVTVTIKNNGLLPWNDGAGVDFNVGVKWNGDPDYLVRVDAQNLAAGATATYSLTVTAPSTASSNNLTFDVVREACFWFASNSGSYTNSSGVLCPASGPGNTVYSSGALNIKVTPANINAGNDVGICIGSNTTLNGSTTTPITLFSENFESYNSGTLSASGSSWKQTEITSTITYWQINTSCIPPQGTKCLNMNDTYNNSTSECDYAWDDAGDEIAWYGTPINASGFTNLKMNFKWRAMGEVGFDYGYVVYSTNGTTWNNVSSTQYLSQSSWQTVSNLTLPASLNGQSFYIGFRWINDGSVGTEPGFNIDDISITGETTLSYLWNPSATLSSSTILNPVATPTATTAYTLSITGNGCTISDNITVIVNNPTPSTTVTNSDYVWRGTSSTDWNTASNWLTYNGSSYSVASSAPQSTSTPNVIIPASTTNCSVSNFPNTGATTVYGKTVTIEASASVTMGSGTMNVSGNFTNNGTFTCGTGTVIFNGNLAQTISGSTSTIFNNLTMNNTAGLTVSKGFTINGELKFTSGNITAATSNEAVTIETSGFVSTTTGSTSADGKCIVGYCKKNTNSNSKFTFPIGSTSLYRPAAITPSNSNPTTWTAKYFNVGYGDYSITGPNLDHVSIVEYWTIDRSATSPADATIELSWASGSGVGANYADLVVAHYNNADWQSTGGANISGTSTSGFVSSSSAWATFSPFTLGSSSTNNPLPVELTDFTVACKNQQVKLNWKTLTENNNSFFGIERSFDGSMFNEVGRVQGNGTTNQPHEYQFFDEQPFNGTSYYRLNQVDYNGQSELHQIVKANCDSENNELNILPNPNSGTFEIIGLSDENQIDVTDVIGKKILSFKSDSSIEKINITGVKPGIYFVNISDKFGKILTKKIIIEN